MYSRNSTNHATTQNFITFITGGGVALSWLEVSMREKSQVAVVLEEEDAIFSTHCQYHTWTKGRLCHPSKHYPYMETFATMVQRILGPWYGCTCAEQYTFTKGFLCSQQTCNCIVINYFEENSTLHNRSWDLGSLLLMWLQLPDVLQYHMAGSTFLLKKQELKSSFLWSLFCVDSNSRDS